MYWRWVNGHAKAKNAAIKLFGRAKNEQSGMYQFDNPDE
jgi:hypothetical protein